MIECPSEGAAGPASDRELLERFLRGGDETAFAGLVRRHGPMVLAVCRRVLRHTHDAEDACQAAFLVLGRKAASIRNRESVAGWLHGVAFRVAARLRRDVNRRRAREEPIVDVAAPNQASELTWREVLAALDEELHTLPERYRAPLVLCYLEGRTRDEAARQLGWSLNALRGRLERGRAQLRARLLRRGLGLSAAWLAAALAPAAKGIEVGRIGTAASVSARTAALAEEVVQAMTPSKLALVAWVLLTVGVLGAGAGVLSWQGRGPLRDTVAAVPPPEAQTADDRLRKEVAQLKRQNEELKRLLLEVNKKVTALEARPPAQPLPAREIHFKGKPASYWLEMLRDRAPDFRGEALKALAGIGKEDARVVPALLAALKDRDVEVRVEAVGALAAVADPKTLPALLELMHDPNEYVRRQTVYALAAVGGPKTLPVLVKALKDRSPSVRQMAAQSLEALGPKARDAVPALIRVLDDRFGHVSQAAANALVRIGAPAVPLLLSALKDPSRAIREHAEVTLGSINLSGKGSDVKRAERALVDALEDPVALVRRIAAAALGRRGAAARRAVPALVRAYEERAKSTDLQDKVARLQAARALWQIDPPAAAHRGITIFDPVAHAVLNEVTAAIPALTKALQDGDVDTRIAVVRTLGKIGQAGGVGQPSSGSPLAPPGVGGSIPGQRPASAVVPALTRALKDANEKVREAARQALDRINDP